MWGVFLITIVPVVITFAVVTLWFVLVAFMTVVIPGDGIVVRIPVASAWHIRTAMFFVITRIVFVTDHLMASDALDGTVVVRLAYLFPLGVLAFFPCFVVLHILRRETRTFVVLVGMEQTLADSALGDSHPRLPILERRALVSNAVRNRTGISFDHGWLLTLLCSLDHRQTFVGC